MRSSKRSEIQEIVRDSKGSCETVRCILRIIQWLCWTFCCFVHWFFLGWSRVVFHWSTYRVRRNAPNHQTKPTKLMVNVQAWSKTPCYMQWLCGFRQSPLLGTNLRGNCSKIRNHHQSKYDPPFPKPPAPGIFFNLVSLQAATSTVNSKLQPALFWTNSLLNGLYGGDWNPQISKNRSGGIWILRDVELQ